MNGNLLAFIALALLGGASGLWFRKMFRVEIPEKRGLWVMAWGASLLMAVWALAAGTSGLGTAAAITSLLVGTFFVFTVAISRQKIAIDAIHVGATIPDAAALDPDGQPYSLSSLRGKPALIKFFRGHW